MKIDLTAKDIKRIIELADEVEQAIIEQGNADIPILVKTDEFYEEVLHSFLNEKTLING